MPDELDPLALDPPLLDPPEEDEADEDGAALCEVVEGLELPPQPATTNPMATTAAENQARLRALVRIFRPPDFAVEKERGSSETSVSV